MQSLNLFTILNFYDTIVTKDGEKNEIIGCRR